jgi:uncharacterized protein YoxC
VEAQTIRVESLDARQEIKHDEIVKEMDRVARSIEGPQRVGQALESLTKSIDGQTAQSQSYLERAVSGIELLKDDVQKRVVPQDRGWRREETEIDTLISAFETHRSYIDEQFQRLQKQKLQDTGAEVSIKDLLHIMKRVDNDLRIMDPRSALRTFDVQTTSINSQLENLNRIFDRTNFEAMMRRNFEETVGEAIGQFSDVARNLDQSDLPLLGRQVKSLEEQIRRIGNQLESVSGSPGVDKVLKVVDALKYDHGVKFEQLDRLHRSAPDNVAEVVRSLLESFSVAIEQTIERSVANHRGSRSDDGQVATLEVLHRDHQRELANMEVLHKDHKQELQRLHSLVKELRDNSELFAESFNNIDHKVDTISFNVKNLDDLPEKVEKVERDIRTNLPEKMEEVSAELKRIREAINDTLDSRRRYGRD